MLAAIARGWKAATFWLKDMCMFWAPVERPNYTVQCPHGHQTVMEREQVLQLTFTASQVEWIDWGCDDNQVVSISYTDCPHPDCVAATSRHLAVLRAEASETQ